MRRLTLAAAFALSTAVPGFAEDSYDVNTVLATVNGTNITLGQMLVVMESLPEQYRSIDDKTLYDGILDQLIGQTAVSDTAGAESKRLSLALLNQKIAIRANEVAGRFAATVTEEEIKAAYEAEISGAAAGQEYNASHILVETEDEAKALIETLNGGADFAELAKEKSTGPSGPRGGELGWFGAGMMVPEFEAAVVALDKGAVSAPVQTQFGWHVVKLNDIRDITPPTLEEKRAELTQRLSEEKVQAGIAGIREAATVETVENAVPPAAIRDTSLLD